MKGKLLVLIAICLASTLGLISLVVPEPTTFTVTSTQPVTATGSQSFTQTVTPLGVVTWTVYPSVCLGGTLIASNLALCQYYQELCSSTVCYVANTYITEASSAFTYTGEYMITNTEYFSQVVQITSTVSYRQVTEGSISIWPNYISGINQAIYTYSPPAIFTSTSMATSTVTSSLTQTGYITKQVPLISTGSTYHEVAIALVTVIVVSLIVVLSLRKGKGSTGQSKLDSWQALN